MMRSTYTHHLFNLNRLAVIAALLCASCSTLKVNTDFDPSANFTAYKTYSWAPEAAIHAAPDISGVPSPLMEKRIRDAVESQLASKGLKRVEASDEPDLWIQNQVNQREKIESSGSGLGVGVGYGYSPWFGGVSVPAYRTRQTTEGTLVLDFVDTKSKKLVWRGIARDAVEDPEESQEQINEAVAKTLEKYPPGPA